jgi:hypothetical protein
LVLAYVSVRHLLPVEVFWITYHLPRNCNTERRNAQWGLNFQVGQHLRFLSSAFWLMTRRSYVEKSVTSIFRYILKMAGEIFSKTSTASFKTTRRNN